MLITAGAEPFRAEAGLEADFIQVREPGLEARALARVVRAWMAALGGASAPPSGFRPTHVTRNIAGSGQQVTRAKILVNDRADVAIGCGAAGVHLRDRSISPARIRAIAPPGFVITVACHDGEGVLRAAAEGADYAVLAPIFAPLSKPAATPPLGLDALRSIASQTGIPVIALGGITVENAPRCIDAGAAGVAGITMFRS